MKRGVPPTARKARTGEFTPPGVTADGRARGGGETGAAYEEGNSLISCDYSDLLRCVRLFSDSIAGDYLRVGQASKAPGPRRSAKLDADTHSSRGRWQAAVCSGAAKILRTGVSAHVSAGGRGGGH